MISRKCVLLVLLSSEVVLRQAVPSAHAQAADENLKSGIAAYKSGDLNKAIRELRESYRRNPNAVAALYLGNAYLQRKNIPEAKQYFRFAIKHDPSKAEAIRKILKEIEARDATTITVVTEPAGAQVFVDGATTAAGVTPLEVEVAAGKHSFRLEHPGYEGAAAQESVVFGQDKSLTVSLVAKPCTVAVSDAPAGTTMALDEQPAGPIAAGMTLALGNHRMVFAAPGFDAKTEMVICSPGAEVKVSAALSPTKGKVRLPIAAEATVKIDGEVVAITPEQIANGLDLPPGRHEIEVLRVGEAPWLKVVEVPSGGEVALEVPPPTPKAPPPAPPKPVLPPPPPFPVGHLYVGVHGTGNVVLRKWDLGMNAFVAQDGISGVSPASSAAAGLRVGYQLMPRALVEAEFGFVGLPNELDTSSGITYSIGAAYHLLPGKWAPIAEAGLGVYQVVGGDLGANADIRAHVGVGVRGKVGKRLVVRADIRDVISDGFDGTGANNLELSAGVEFSLTRIGPARRQ